MKFSTLALLALMMPGATSKGIRGPGASKDKISAAEIKDAIAKALEHDRDRRRLDELNELLSTLFGDALTNLIETGFNLEGLVTSGNITDAIDPGETFLQDVENFVTSDTSDTGLLGFLEDVANSNTSDTGLLGGVFPEP